jgi:uncharacterized RDD family membrane protein YckC
LDPLDNLSIDTPEQIALEFQIAGIGSRFLAMAVDTLIHAGLYILFALAFWGIAALLIFIGGAAARSANVSTAVAETAGMWVGAIAIFVFFCVYWGYFALFEAIWKGQTPGKRVAKIRVIKDSGRPITAVESIGRNLMRVVDWLPFLYGVGVVTMMCNAKNRRLGDFVAGTVVVHERVEKAIRPDWSNLSGETPAALAGELTGLDARDLELIETFLQRRHDIDQLVRYATADRIADHLRAKANITPQPGQTVEAFLEQVARGMRDAGRYATRQS